MCPALVHSVQRYSIKLIIHHSMLHIDQARLLVAPWQADAESDMAAFNIPEVQGLYQHHDSHAGMHLWHMQILGLTQSGKLDSNMHTCQCASNQAAAQS